MLMKEVFIIALGYCNEIGTKVMKKNDIISCTLYNDLYVVINYRIL